jgi:inositol-phosphate transport system substrate-binding protein
MRLSRRRLLIVFTGAASAALAAACSTTPVSSPAAPTAAPAKPAESKPAESKPAESKPAAPAAQPAATGAPAAAQPAAPAPTATPVVDTKASGTVSGGQVVKITAWTIGPDAPSYYRRDNLVAGADNLNKDLEKEGSPQRVQVEGTFESGGSWDNYKQKFTLAAEAKQGPDIILSGHEDLAPWSTAGYVVALDDWIKKYEQQFADIYPSLWPAMKYKGKTYGIPQDAEARPMYYRKDLLAKLGWPKEKIDGLPEAVKKGEWAWPDLVDTAKEAMSKGVVENGKGWYGRSTKGFDHYMFYFQNGGQMQDPDTGKLVIVKDALEKFFQLHYDAVKTHKITPENFLGMEGKIWHETVTSGKVLFANAGTWTWADWIKTYKVPEQQQWDNVGLTLIPAAQKGGKPTTLTHPLVYSVTGNSQNQELAFRLIAAATTPELNSRHSVESAHLAILKSQEKDPTYQKDKFLLGAAYMLEYTTFAPNHPKFGAYDEIIWRLLTAVEAGQMQPKDAVGVATDELQAQLKDDLIVK